MRTRDRLKSRLRRPTWASALFRDAGRLDKTRHRVPATELITSRRRTDTVDNYGLSQCAVQYRLSLPQRRSRAEPLLDPSPPPPPLRSILHQVRGYPNPSKRISSPTTRLHVSTKVSFASGLSSIVCAPRIGLDVGSSTTLQVTRRERVTTSHSGVPREPHFRARSHGYLLYKVHLQISSQG